MEITKLEKTVRQAARDGSLGSTLATPESKDEAGLNLSPEFDQATKTLAAKRRVRRHAATTLLNTTTARWL
jgi:hypothetical protein